MICLAPLLAIAMQEIQLQSGNRILNDALSTEAYPDVSTSIIAKSLTPMPNARPAMTVISQMLLEYAKKSVQSMDVKSLMQMV